MKPLLADAATPPDMAWSRPKYAVTSVAPTRQCAAVSTIREWMIAPPHRKVPSSVSTSSRTCHGYLAVLVVVPPTMSGRLVPRSSAELVGAVTATRDPATAVARIDARARRIGLVNDIVGSSHTAGCEITVRRTSADRRRWRRNCPTLGGPDGSAREGDRVHDDDLELLAVGRLVADGVALGRAEDRGAERGLRRVDLEAAAGGILHLTGAEQERLDVVVGVADELVGDLHAGLDDAVVGRGLADLGAVEHVLELPDPALELALLLAGGVVAAVLLEVALVTGRADPGDDVLADGTLEVLELVGELVERVLGEPDLALCCCLRHGVTPACFFEVRRNRSVVSSVVAPHGMPVNSGARSRFGRPRRPCGERQTGESNNRPLQKQIVQRGRVCPGAVQPSSSTEGASRSVRTSWSLWPSTGVKTSSPTTVWSSAYARSVQLATTSSSASRTSTVAVERCSSTTL